MNAMDADFALVAEAHGPSVVAVEQAKGDEKVRESVDTEIGSDTPSTEPTIEELKTLRRVSGKITWQMMTITFVEFCERFSYYGTTAVFVNFIQQSRPFGSRTGNIQDNTACISRLGLDACLQPGGLGQDQQAATGLTVSAIMVLQTPNRDFTANHLTDFQPILGIHYAFGWRVSNITYRRRSSSNYCGVDTLPTDTLDAS